MQPTRTTTSDAVAFTKSEDWPRVGVEHFSDLEDASQRDLAFAALDLTDIGPVQVGACREVFAGAVSLE
ncbi:MAG TPA: hypothetical protein DCQ04_12025 [Actinobacteria bacterium]|nr:hypothetical protein [Actinomycetota bacterium]